jgi:hypothetical protein
MLIYHDVLNRVPKVGIKTQKLLIEKIFYFKRSTCTC